jgi:hypothetical protein
MDSYISQTCAAPYMFEKVSSLTKSDQFRKNAGNCAQLADRATDAPTFNRYKRMEEAWMALAEEQAWLDGEAHMSGHQKRRP